MESQKVHMSRKQFRIGDLAQELKLKKFVIRFWEKEFDLKSDRSHGGQRFYTSEDLQTFLIIKDLLYRQGFTIAGAKKQLETLLSQGSDAIEKVIEQPCAVSAPLHADESMMAASYDTSPASDFIDDQERAHAVPVADIQAAVVLENMHETITSQAPAIACSCPEMFQALRPLKEQLYAFKALLETNR